MLLSGLPQRLHDRILFRRPRVETSHVSRKDGQAGRERAGPPR